MIRDISSDDSSSASSEHSYFDSEASRIDFWNDINTEDSKYGNAVIVSGGNVASKEDPRSPDR